MAGLSIQAVGATVLLVVPLGAIGAMVTGAGARASAFAVFSMASPLVFVVLPVVTALLMEHFTWRVVAGLWALGAVAAWVVGRRSLAPDPPDPPKLELIAPLLAGILCVGVLQTVSHVASEGLTSPATLGRLAIAMVSLALLT